MGPNADRGAPPAPGLDETFDSPGQVPELLKRSPLKVAAAICSEKLSDQAAEEMFRAAYAVQPQFDAILLKYAQEHAPRSVSRVLNWLGTLTDCRRIMPALIELTHSEHDYLRAQAVLLLARVTTNVDLLVQLMNDSDPRVRANVVEGHKALSGDDPVIEKALSDTHHRVLGNAAVQLLETDVARACRIVAELAVSPDWRARAGAAWVINFRPVADLMPIAERLAKDTHPRVMLSGQRALKRFRDARLLESTASQQLVPDVQPSA